MVESFQDKEINEKKMESRSYSLVFIGPPTSGKSTFATFIAETLHLPVVNGASIVDPEKKPTDGSLVPDDIFNESLGHRLEQEPPTGHIFDGVPRTPSQAKIVAEWSKKQGFPIHVINLEISEEEVVDRTQNREICPACAESYHFKIKPSINPGRCNTDNAALIKRQDDNNEIIKKRLAIFNQEKAAVLEVLQSYGFQIHNIDSNGVIRNTNRKILEELSPLSFDDPQLTTKYFQLKDFCESQGIDFMFISGACGYIYRGRSPLKDLDVYVPTKDGMEIVAKSIGVPTESLESSYAISQYLNYSSGVELVTDLSIKYTEDGQSKVINFPYQRLDQDARIVRFFGENVKIMSPEWLIILKLCMGRSGQDDFGHNKNDYADAYDVTVSQPVDYDLVMSIAKEVGAEKRVVSGLEILRSSAD